ncbi:endonuclease V [Planococcus lenghuensis]|uniref:Endonuclease V n=1 Tax=Planococcus lenghuensis TaxID=2213202 RepID=A0A1Q2KXG5_9BACL|nr:endonuclease V [Planococcus lenghuensis]AQQ52362.1 endonuclease V [Planococcus lenghuensis]
MELNYVHPFRLAPRSFKCLQEQLADQLDITRPLPLEGVRSCAGVDLAYWKEGETERGVCSIVVIDNRTHEIMEQTMSIGTIQTPYIPGYLAFRELPLIAEAAEQLTVTPDVFLFDGNGTLHPRRMGIASHAAFFLNRPTVGVAKSYFKIGGIDFKMPGNEKGDFTDIRINGEVTGRALRTAEKVKPVFVSPGNRIDLESATQLVLSLVNKDSRLPVPIRLADLESRRLKREAK